MTKTAVVIVHYKGESDTLECIRSFYPHIPRSILPIVVTNQSSAKFGNELMRTFPRIILIKNRENKGVAAGNNIGIRRGMKEKCASFILLNNDTIVSKDLFIRISDFFVREQSVGIVSPKIYFAKGNEYHKNRYEEYEKGRVLWYAGGSIDWNNMYAHHRGVDEVDKGQYEKTVETDFSTGCCMFIKKEVLEKIGLLDEKYFLYFEDVDYSVRARQSGFRILYYPKAHLWHKNASSSGKAGSDLHRYYQTRNRLYFGYRYASLRTKKSLFFESVRQEIHGGIERKAVTDYYLHRMGKGSI